MRIHVWVCSLCDRNDLHVLAVVRVQGKVVVVSVLRPDCCSCGPCCCDFSACIDYSTNVAVGCRGKQRNNPIILIFNSAHML